jgi:hypothetical protein
MLIRVNTTCDSDLMLDLVDPCQCLIGQDGDNDRESSRLGLEPAMIAARETGKRASPLLRAFGTAPLCALASAAPTKRAHAGRHADGLDQHCAGGDAMRREYLD